MPPDEIVRRLLDADLLIYQEFTPGRGTVKDEDHSLPLSVDEGAVFARELVDRVGDQRWWTALIERKMRIRFAMPERSCRSDRDRYFIYFSPSTDTIHVVDSRIQTRLGPPNMQIRTMAVGDFFKSDTALFIYLNLVKHSLATAVSPKARGFKGRVDQGVTGARFEPRNAAAHYAKHWREFGDVSISLEQYVFQAKQLAERDAGGDIAVKRDGDGNFVKMNVATHEFVVVRPNGRIKTYFIKR
ncbi:MAG TPA: hypothetical protein VEY30_08915 [Myxococcaceae bacterium]|nr:hypothetical protein [Myxococcaceae bacterium]